MVLQSLSGRHRAGTRIPLLALSLLWGSSGVQAEEKHHPVTFATIAMGGAGTSEQRAKRLQVIDNMAEFKAVYTLAGTTTRPIPSVDFDTQRVIAVFMGEQNSGGHAIEVTSLQDQGKYLQVNVRTTVPGARCMTTQALTYPYHFVQLAKQPKELLFVESRAVRECS